VLIERSLLRRPCDPDLRAALEGIADAGFIPVRPGAVADFARWLKQAVEDANGRPEALARPGATARWEAQLLTRLGDTLDEARAVRGRSVYSARRQGMDRALEHLRLAQPSAVKMTRLAEVAGVSQRTLEYGFRDLFGLTPIGFQQLLRLHAARRELAAAERGCIRIGEVADRHGFPQHGRFAVNYRDLFGESPSATLRRPGARVPADGASAVRG
jgi:AraC family ethanolamine operon transcriptional activator